MEKYFWKELLAENNRLLHEKLKNYPTILKSTKQNN